MSSRVFCSRRSNRAWINSSLDATAEYCSMGIVWRRVSPKCDRAMPEALFFLGTLAALQRGLRATWARSVVRDGSPTLF